MVEGDASSDATFTVTNIGTAVSNTLSATLGGADATEFGMGTNTCVGAMLPVGETCTIGVTFQPTSTGSANAMLTVTDGRTTAIAWFEGNGVECRLRITPTPRDFGTTAAGTATASTMFTVESTCLVPTGLLTTIVGGVDASQFTLGVDNCTGMTLAPGARCTVDGIYTPTVAGPHAATIEVSEIPGGTATASVSGTATTPAALQLLPGTRDFGSSPIGTATAAFTYVVTNTGGAATGPLTVAVEGANPADFPIVGGSDSCTGRVVPASGTCTVALIFNPTASGALAAELRVVGSPGGMTAASLTGNGI